VGDSHHGIRNARVIGSNPIAGSRNLRLTSADNYSLDGVGIALNHRKENPCGPIRHGATLLSLLNCAL